MSKVAIGENTYEVCDKCGAVRYANFNCSECRNVMRQNANEFLIRILDYHDKHDEVHKGD